MWAIHVDQHFGVDDIPLPGLALQASSEGIVQRLDIAEDFEQKKSWRTLHQVYQNMVRSLPRG